MVLGDTAASLISFLTGICGVLSAYGAVLIAIHVMRNKERQQADRELRNVGRLLGLERRERINCEGRAFRLTVLAAQRGAVIPPELLEPIKEVSADDEADRYSPAPVQERGRRGHRRRRAADDVADNGPVGGVPGGQGSGSEAGEV